MAPRCASREEKADLIDEDYEALTKVGVDVAGSAVVVRKGDDHSRGAVVWVAQRAGAAAVLIYAEDDRTVKSGVSRLTTLAGMLTPIMAVKFWG
ncbi:hypothetical protein SAY87_030047 [Trapa incisa]|uniref:PA domain-containing protein n=1 Tax=Trapa incisa TaxID=236973 RepID=A0AAN7K5I5_9MYRT|nr:hypothetical protein SAY87_030047 [Trapa incisa]